MRSFRKVTNFVRNILIAVNVVVIVALCACGYAGHVSPANHPWIELLVLAFPIPLTLNVLFLLFWLFVSPRHIILPIAGLLLCWGPVRAYCPVNIPKEPDDECIKVMSFNIAGFAYAKHMESVMNTVVDYLLTHEVDILCLQETNRPDDLMKQMNSLIRRVYPYSSVIRKRGRETIAFHSKFPILSSQRIMYKTRNTTGACVIDINGDSVLLVNIHLESTFLKNNEMNEIGSMIQKKRIDREKGSVLKKLCMAAARRASQADSVALFLEKHKGMPTILCGDFNDPTNSYAYHRVAQRLDNCYQSTETGLAHTFNKKGLKVRIDNIFCSKDLEPVKCEIDYETHVSDHFPISCWIKKRPKP